MNKKIQPRMQDKKMNRMNEDELLQVTGGAIDDSNIREMIIYKCHPCDITFATPEGLGPGKCPVCGKGNDDEPNRITML